MFVSKGKYSVVCSLHQHGAVLYKSYQAAVKRVSPQQTVQTETHRGQTAQKIGSRLNPDVGKRAIKTLTVVLMAALAEETSCGVEDFPYEPPPDFVPPPPPPHPPRSAEV